MTFQTDHPWLAPLFGDPDTAELWSADAQLRHFRAFEMALARALGAHGLVSAEIGQQAAASIADAPVDLDLLARATATDGIPIPDFVAQLRAAAPESAAAIHTGATSQDVMDTALSLTLVATTDLLSHRLSALSGGLEALSLAQGTRQLMARTRMQAALPMTVADRIKSWLSPVDGAVVALADIRPKVARLQLGGAIGTRHAFNGKGDNVARHMAAALDLTESGVWHSDRSQIAHYASLLSQITGTLGKMGQDIALMAQQGIDEITLSGGGGSSAMPHKSNPVLAELLVTLARFNATQISAMHHSLIHEQERSGAAWMLEWMVLPQMATATAKAIAISIELCGKIKCIGSSPGETGTVH